MDRFKPAYISKITVQEDGNKSYFSELAHQVLFNNKVAKYVKIEDSERFFVFFDDGSKDLVLKIGSSKDLKSVEDYIMSKSKSETDLQKWLIVELK